MIEKKGEDKSEVPILDPKPHPIAKEIIEARKQDDEEKDLDKLEKDTLKDIQKILKDHDGKESDIGLASTHRYWELKNQYRALLSRPGRVEKVAAPKKE